ncbi:VOC family protein [Streptomyces spiramenti]|uniref:Glyoxalase n=1 Tax=Streptomyces spiramenti TaxID=2720606 RepID=A0ABX1AU09_9ACTN|nr:VOC family protein [Streptomyces spiramenti]NJP69206.1 glyoxalase [Streptomyces spiramenti]
MRMIFVNLPVRDVTRSREFFGALDLEFDEEYSSEDVLCVRVEENIHVMLLEEEPFRGFINGEIADSATTEVLTCITADSPDEVDGLVTRALAAGGRPWKPTFSEGPMYGGSFQDPDGHVWELMALLPGTEEPPAP